jgi:hypothetical protein
LRLFALRLYAQRHIRLPAPLLLVLAGLPEPDVNFILRAPDGSWRRRFDLCYQGARLIIEYDGRQHAFDREQWSNDIARREELDGLRRRNGHGHGRFGLQMRICAEKRARSLAA